MFVLRIEQFFLLVDIQHTQCPRGFSILERYKLCGHKPTTQATTLYYVDRNEQYIAIATRYKRQLPRCTEKEKKARQRKTKLQNTKYKMK